jgi:DNA-binding MarR family transcriptional regulator
VTGRSHNELVPAARSLALLARKLERACGVLSLPQYRVLAMVAAGDERSSRLAERLAVARPTVTAVVDGLVERHLLAREAVEGDRRSIRLRVTADGAAALANAETAMAESLEDLFAEVTDREGLVQGLTEMHDAWLARVGARLGAVTS